jgi:tRNA 2-thiouridine synthesizing protein D
MKFAILINEGPFTHQASDSAYRFTEAALARGHEIYRVFFYNDGVYNANRYSEPQTDDRNLVALWARLGKEHEIDLVVCVAAGLRRGVKDEVLEDGFRISGLGQLVEAGIQADRLVVFGD